MQLLKVSLVVSLTLIIIGCSTVEPPAPIGDIPTVEVPTPTIEGDIEVEVSQNAPSLVTPTIDPVRTPTPGPTSTAVPHSTITSSLTPTPTPTVEFNWAARSSIRPFLFLPSLELQEVFSLKLTSQR